MWPTLLSFSMILWRCSEDALRILWRFFWISRPGGGEGEGEGGLGAPWGVQRSIKRRVVSSSADSFDIVGGVLGFSGMLGESWWVTGSNCLFPVTSHQMDSLGFSWDALGCSGMLWR